MDKIKHAIIYWFFTHIFLRRIGKRYPEFFKCWVYDYIEKPTLRKTLRMKDEMPIL